MKTILKFLAIALIVGFANAQAHAWTITVSGTIYKDDPHFTDYASPFGDNLSLIGLPYTTTITTTPYR